MDYAYKFEELINEILGKPSYITYATNWENVSERNALLFTACIIKYDLNNTGKIGEKLEYFIENIFQNDDEIGINCLNFLSNLK